MHGQEWEAKKTSTLVACIMPTCTLVYARNVSCNTDCAIASVCHTDCACPAKRVQSPPPSLVLASHNRCQTSDLTCQVCTVPGVQLLKLNHPHSQGLQTVQGGNIADE